MLTAITRGVSASLAVGELTFRDREPIDVALARTQHAAYERALESLGVRIDHLPADDALPDAVFVEDAALM
ncbi:MAG: dimethylargininase, partial [Chloroflexota bacterium]|nr:dimethylargininase [Chloroflexota bacterium]